MTAPVAHRLGALSVELIVGDIAAQTGIDAVVNAANAQLVTGGGVAGALHRAAGPGLAREARNFAPIRPGEAVITAGYDLPNRFVIHCLGPVYGRDTPSDELLASCYREALRLAHENGVRSIAFPALSTGVFGYPMEAAAKVAFETISQVAAEYPEIERVRFVLYDRDAFAVHERVISALAGDSHP